MPLNPLHPRPRTLRLASGLILLTYVATHLLNHAVGLVSLAAAEAGREWFVAFWRSAPATAAFYGALLLHFSLAVAALYERHTLRMPPLELARIALGFAIPLLLAFHMVQTRLAWELTGWNDNYRRITASMWASNFSLRQLAMISIVWLHACFGLQLAFRHRAGWRRWQLPLVALATLLPTLAFTGYLAMAREAFLLPVQSRPPTPADATLQLAVETVFYLPLGLLALTLAARWAQVAWARSGGRVLRITYPAQAVDVPAGFSVLEASRAFGIPHMSVCGGRARCSTCRIEVLSSAGPLPPANPDEAATLARIGAPPGVRLACQLRPTAPLAVRPLAAVRGSTPASEAWGANAEREIVVLFADLRRWTTLSEHHLPFDLVYVLDQYFEAVGDAVREAGGVPNQFIGDSVMALFGLETDTVTAARQALTAAEAIERRMAAVNDSLAAEFRRPLDFGIGIHAGTAAVGTVGYRDTRTLTAVGDAVNTASRLQELTKLLKVRIVVSEEVLRRAGGESGDWQRHELEIRGRQGRMAVYARTTFCAAPAEAGS
ncbi:adenylate/guanylate cyclase domain-containing protein [Ramlibacter monticola]|uniref:adenylate/guanylate cyclase domain-containing protein n=1 Tax=Ramlibacter monticola TaxID=1926872 RepID=UPI001F329A4A|nr:adenylate/guanylate cyclase domain-containing protein [Ramlibacter monticola]